VKGIDCASPLTATKANAIAAEGYKFAARYLVPVKYAWKRIIRLEAEAITKAGMKILSVYETTANRPKGGAANGKVDGAAAYKEAQEIGQPLGSAIYFACDWDANSGDFDAIEAYLRAAAKEVVGYTVGVYAEFDVIEEMAKRKACQHFWQTYAWSKGKRSMYANVYQYKNGQVIAYHSVDLNESYGNEGFWDTNPVTVKGPYSDIDGHWAKTDIIRATEAGLLAGYPDGTFKPDQPLTRAEFASALVRFDKMIKGVKQ